MVSVLAAEIFRTLWGTTTLAALDALEEDAATEVIAIISKPPGEKTLTALVERIKTCRKPVVCCVLGTRKYIEGEGTVFKRARIIDEAVQLAIEAIGGEFKQPAQHLEKQPKPQEAQKGKYLRGVFAGGTFCYQSQQILRDAGINIYSNGP